MLQSDEVPFHAKLEATIVCVDKCMEIVDEIKTCFKKVNQHIFKFTVDSLVPPND